LLPTPPTASGKWTGCVGSRTAAASDAGHDCTADPSVGAAACGPTARRSRPRRP
jgi:hypothetical protein